MKMNLSSRRRIRNDFDNWSDGLDCDWAVGLAFNRPCSFQKARAALRSFALILDRILLGPKCLSKESERTFFLAMPEHPDTNFHYHALVKIRAKRQIGWLTLVSAMTRAWTKVAPAGTVHLQEIRDQGAARYAAKDLVKRGHIDEFIISSEFHSGQGSTTRSKGAHKLTVKE